MARPQAYTRKFADELAKDLLEWVKVLANPDSKPDVVKKRLFIERFLFSKNVNPRRIADLIDRSPKFGEAYEMFKEIQAVILQEGGLNDEFNARITALLLSHHHDIREKKEIQTTSQLDAMEQLFGSENG